MGADVLDAERPDPIDGGTETDRLGDLGRAGLELPREIGPRGRVRANGADHVTATDERRHLLEQRAAPVEDTDAGRPVRLMARPRVEVGIDHPQVDGNLGNRLGPVDEDRRAGGVRAAHDVRHRIDGADDVRDVNECEEFRLACEEAIECVEIELSVVPHGYVGELGAAVGGEQLPGNDVRVVLHLGQDDEVTGADVRSAPGVRDEIDRRRRIGGEDRLLRAGSEPLRDPAARTLEQVRRLDGEGVDAAVDRGPGLRVVPGHRVDHRLRRLRRRRRVEVRDRVAVELPTKDRELRCQIAAHARRHGGHD